VLHCTDNQKILLPIVEDGNSLMDEFVEGLQRRELGKFIPVLSDCAEEWELDIASTTTSETLTSDGELALFCGMGRIATARSERIWNWENIETARVNLLIQIMEPRIIGARRIERTLLRTVARSTSIALNGKALKYLKELILC
jgi:hypothetical protein